MLYYIYKVRKGKNKMKIVSVKFSNYGKNYAYFTDKNLMVGATYEIVADGTTAYNTPVIVTGYLNSAPRGIQLRTITSAKLLNAPKRPESKIEKVIFNEDKLTTVVLWTDGTKTIVRCQPGDTFNKETGIAMAFMKRCYGNRGCYNEEFKRFAR
jgi:hypothetical protein